MLIAVCFGLAALNIESRSPLAEVMYARATLTTDVHHAVFSMPLAVRRRLPAFEIEGRLLGAGVMQTQLATNVYHAVPSMLVARRRRLAAFGIEHRGSCAGAM